MAADQGEPAGKLVATLNHVRRGRGEPLLLVHPLGGELVVWSPVLDLLAPHREVVAVDMPGFGSSPPLDRGVVPTPRNLARAVIGVWDSLGFDRDPHMAGISLGAWVAIECAKAGRAGSVTALCPAGFWSGPLGPSKKRASQLARLVSPALPLVMRAKLVRRLALSRFIAHPERLSAAEAARMGRSYAISPAFAEASRAMRSDLITDLEQVRVPVTVAWGELDELVQQPPEGRIPDGIPQLTLRGCGHVPTWDDPELVARVILEGSGGPRLAPSQP
jgi:pimeloyl-ACP methyl ester carboxylesterase